MNPLRCPTTCVIAAATLVVTIGGGCASSPLAERELEERRAGIQQTLSVAAESEAKRPERLARAGPWIAQNLERHAELLERDAAGAGEWYRRDVERFQRREADYLEKLWQILRGKPENIEDNAIILFY